MGDMNGKIGDLIHGNNIKGSKDYDQNNNKNNMIILKSLENVEESGQEVVEGKRQ